MARTRTSIAAISEAIAGRFFPVGVWRSGVRRIKRPVSTSIFWTDTFRRIIPIEVVGRMVLTKRSTSLPKRNRPRSIRGMDTSTSPTTRSRRPLLFSYTDTRISRLSGANFLTLPINRPLSDADLRRRDTCDRIVHPDPGRHGDSLDPSGPRENPSTDFRTFSRRARAKQGSQKLRLSPKASPTTTVRRASSCRSMSAPSGTIQNAFPFEFSKVETPVIRHVLVSRARLEAGPGGRADHGGERAEITPIGNRRSGAVPALCSSVEIRR